MTPVVQSGTVSDIVIDLEDESGAPLAVDSVGTAELTVYNQDGVVAVPTEVGIIIPNGASEYAATVGAAANTVQGSAAAESRVIELIVPLLNGSSYTIRKVYVIENPVSVQPGQGSFMGLPEAHAVAATMLSTYAWDDATERDRRRALLEAHDGICLVPMTQNVSELTADALLKLDARFLSALKHAQVAQADFLLSDETLEHKRSDGLMSETTGESSAMFRPGKPISSPVCVRAMRYLSPYIAMGLSARK